MDNESGMAVMPGRLSRSMYFARGGRIAFNMSILAAVLSLISAIAPVASTLFVFIGWAIIAIVAILTLFSIFAIAPDFIDSFRGTSENVEAMGTVLGVFWRFTAPLALALGTTAIVCFLMDREYKHVPKIVISGIIVAMQIVILIVCSVSGR